jgi:hypothetical protein
MQQSTNKIHVVYVYTVVDSDSIKTIHRKKYFSKKRGRGHLSMVDIERIMQEDNDSVEDNDVNAGYIESEASRESSDEEKHPCTSTPTVSGWRRRVQPKEHVMIHMDPPLERADADTDGDSG